jgi:hypothetical protein
MAGMGTYLDVLAALNALPQGAAPQLPTGPTSAQAIAPPAPLTAPAPPMPDMAPTAGPVPLDPSIIARYLAQAGPEPVRPTVAPASTLQRVAAALQGFSAGVQGRGGEFVSNLKAERDRPIREYEAKRQEYEGRRSQLGLIGTQAAERASAATQARTQEVADRKADREFKTWLQRAQITDEQAIQQARQAFDLQKIREQERVADERLQSQQKAQQQKDARTFASAYRKAGAGKFAKELGDYDAGLTEALSPEAAKWESAQARLAEIRANRAASGGAGGGTTERTVVELVGPDGQVLGQMRYGELRFDQGAPAGFPPGTQVRLQGQATAPTALPSPFPANLGFPELTPQGAAPQANMSRTQSKRKLVKAGFSSAEADKELDRLGIR